MLVTGLTPLVVVNHPDYDGPQWPTNLYEINKYFPNVSFGIPQEEENLVDFNIFPIHPGTPPIDDVVTKVTPALIDGKWVQQYEHRPFDENELADNLEAARSSALYQLDFVLSNTYDRGFEHEVDSQPHVFSLTSDNRQLITGLYILANDETDLTRKFKLRTMANAAVIFTVDELKTFAKAVIEYVTAVLEKLWDIMEQITEAVKIEDLPEIPEHIDLLA